MAGSAHHDLDLLFGRSGTGYQAQILRSPAGDGQTVTFARPFTDLELENFVLKVGRFKARTRRVDAPPVAAAKLFGGQLFDAVFTGAVGECLRRSLDHARDGQSTLRIRLRLADCPELADLPWELLYDRSDDWFLALSDRTPIVRYVQLPVQPRSVDVTLPLRILVIRSEPLDYPPLDLAAEWAQVMEALSPLTDAGLLAFTELAAPTLGELRRALLRDTFHVLHYMGHGGFDQERGGVLLFTGRAGRGLPVTAADLGVLLRDHTSLSLAVLNACEAGRTDPADPFAGVADTLVRRGIPAVIAMQFEVSDEAAIEFAPALYGALASGRPVDAAVAEARKAIYTVSPLEWVTPVLYLRADNAQLFDISQHTPEQTPEHTPQHTAEDTPQHTPEDTLQRTPEDTPQRQPSAALEQTDNADRLYGQHLYAEAETAYRAAIALDSGLASAHAGLGDALCRLKRYQEGETASREAIRLDPAFAPGHASLSRALHGLERYPEAEAASREAIRLDPAFAPGHSNLGATLMRLARLPEAEAACREAIRLDPTMGLAHSNLGAVLLVLRRFPEAEAACQEAIRLDPGIFQAHGNLGRALFRLKRLPEAEAACRESIRLDLTFGLAHANLGSILLRLERLPEAEAALREAIRLDPALARPHFELGLVLRATKRDQEADAAYREAIRLDPTYGNARYAAIRAVGRIKGWRS
jgi:tetratricopeptide (TPR) repeat protein